MMVRPAERAALTSTVEDGVAMGVAAVGVGLEALPLAEGAPQPTKANAAATDDRAWKSFIAPTVAPWYRTG